jgi:hypothetical protein
MEKKAGIFDKMKGVINQLSPEQMETLVKKVEAVSTNLKPTVTPWTILGAATILGIGQAAGGALYHGGKKVTKDILDASPEGGQGSNMFKQGFEKGASLQGKVNAIGGTIKRVVQGKSPVSFKAGDLLAERATRAPHVKAVHESTQAIGKAKGEQKDLTNKMQSLAEEVKVLHKTKNQHAKELSKSEKQYTDLKKEFKKELQSRPSAPTTPVPTSAEEAARVRTEAVRNPPNNAQPTTAQVPVTNAPAQTEEPGFFKRQWDTLSPGGKTTAKVLAGGAAVGGTIYAGNKVHQNIQQRSEQESIRRQEQQQQMYARQMGAQY